MFQTASATHDKSHISGNKSADFPAIIYPQIAQIFADWGHIGKRPRATTVEKYELCNENMFKPQPLPYPAVTPAGKKRRTEARCFDGYWLQGDSVRRNFYIEMR